ncbi:GNAT family N-acetyltransferase [Marinilactibacillus psychrotolerans]|uniref:GNAT family N-acetyltransferase n=1 Tax=Marinilactibacillus psychrotolerans TaxID=191770 RepID=UPI0039AF3D1E
MFRLEQISIEQVQILKDISIETFTDTFAEANDPTHMKEYINNHYTLEQLTKELSHPHSEFYFISQDSVIAGYLKINRDTAQTEHTHINSLEIERIYIRNPFKRMGLGKKLIQKACERAHAMHLDSIWLGVWEENLQALHFYNIMGFKQSGSHSFFLGSDEQTDLILKKSLN